MKCSNRTTCAYALLPKLRIKSKKNRYTEIVETSVSDKTLEYRNAESISLYSEKTLNEEAESSSTSSYTSSNEPKQMIDSENANNYQPSYTPLVNTVEVSVNHDVDPMYDIIDYKHLSDDIIDAPVNNEESDVAEVSVNEVLEDNDESDFTDTLASDVLEDMLYSFKATAAYEDLVKVLKHPDFRKEHIPTNIQEI
ncbi:5458_t:CDS:2 [Cetraspora pellucida]|uniref:5458_t:CDS:1 n=1 Tax=Cetraspora pellucida TaxID=1433469 RepID=A0ACA9M807_9GLOM|nr:5458_t:CDS:2 [Cetraspora pellucida]